MLLTDLVCSPVTASRNAAGTSSGQKSLKPDATEQSAYMQRGTRRKTNEPDGAKTATIRRSSGKDRHTFQDRAIRQLNFSGIHFLIFHFFRTFAPE